MKKRQRVISQYFSVSAKPVPPSVSPSVEPPPSSPTPRIEEPTTVPDPVIHAKFLSTLLHADPAGRHGQVQNGSTTTTGDSITRNEKYTPLENQVRDLKAEHPGVFLLFEVGYRYRMFGEDAERGSKILGIYAHVDHHYLTASIPTFTLHIHVRRLVQAGLKVGVVRQSETAAIKAHSSAKSGPFTRSLSAIYTMATIEACADLGGQDTPHDRLSTHLVCVAEESTRGGEEDVTVAMVAVEASTGDVSYAHFSESTLRSRLESHLLSVAPVEILILSPLSSLTLKVLTEYSTSHSIRLEHVSREDVSLNGAAADLVDMAASTSEEEEGRVDSEGSTQKLQALLSLPPLVLQSMAAASSYLSQFGLRNVLRSGCEVQRMGDTAMALSPNALQQLEILTNSVDGSLHGTLLWLMDHTVTPAGSRLMRQWICHPSMDASEINARLDAVAELAGAGSRCSGTSRKRRWGDREGVQPTTGLSPALHALSQCADIERGVTRIFHGTATPAQFVASLTSLLTASQLMAAWKQQGVQSPLLCRLLETATSRKLLDSVRDWLGRVDARSATDGDMLHCIIASGTTFPEISRLRSAVAGAEAAMDALLADLRTTLRCPDLRYRSVAGTNYLIEVPLAQRVPPDWLKISSTKQLHRYHPPQVLAAMDSLALCREQLQVASAAAWQEMLAGFGSLYPSARLACQAMASLDCLHSLAILSLNQGYVRPTVLPSTHPPLIHISDGRHPVLEAVVSGEFVPNDTFLSSEGPSCQLITGPNMGGKSVYIRQVALLTVMAQVQGGGSRGPVLLPFARLYPAAAGWVVCPRQRGHSERRGRSALPHGRQGLAGGRAQHSAGGAE